MKSQNFLFYIILTLTVLILSCSLQNPQSPQQGNISISLVFPEGADSGLAKPLGTTGFGRVHCTIINSDYITVIDQNLSHNSNKFRGEFSLQSGSGYMVFIRCYGNFEVCQGNRTNVTVESGKPTTLQITLSEIIVLPQYAILSKNNEQVFKSFTHNDDYENPAIDVTKYTTFSTSPGGAGSITSCGTFTASASYTGIKTVTATYGNKEGTAIVMVQ